MNTASVRWSVLAGLGAVIAMVAVLLGSGTPALAANNSMSVTLAVAGPKGLTSQFDAKINLVNATENAATAWQASIQYDPTILSWVPVGSKNWTYNGIGGLVNAATASAQDLFPPAGNESTFGGEATGGDPISANGPEATVRFQCIAAGTSALHLVTVAESAGFGSAYIDADANFLATDLADTSVTCQEQSDIVVTKTHVPAAPIAGGPITYTVTAQNIGPQPARGVVLVDIVPADKVVQGVITCPGPAPFCAAPGVLPGSYVGPLAMGFPAQGGVDVTGDTVPDAPCKYYAAGYPNLYPPPPLLNNLVACYIAGASSPSQPAIMPAMPVGLTATLTVPVVVDLMSAGKTNINSGAVPDMPDGLGNHTGKLLTTPLIPETNPTTDPTVPDQVFDSVVIAPASVAVVKSGPAQKLTGDAGVYTITVDSQGPSPASNVVVTDTLPAGVTFVSGSAGCGAVGQLVTCTLGNLASTSVGVDVTITINVTFDTAGTAVNSCTVVWSDPSTADCAPVTTLVLPPFNGMVKDARPDLPGIQDAVNLWLCKIGPDCFLTGPAGNEIGKGILDIADILFLRADTDSPNDSDTDPEGLAAYEEELKFDSSLFSVTINDAGSDGLDNDGDTVIDNPEESAIGSPLWRGNINCTMTILTENSIRFGCVSAGQALGNPMPVGVWLKTIRLTPNPDLFLRIRPTKDNGVVTNLIDENCEVADMFASEPWPFTLAGGRTEDCTGVTVTIRMLEGDLNLDCMVNVLDEQLIAYRYGASFGLLLYSPFYDLEPKIGDYDIDIKDLQFVWGREGSMCQAPIPDGQTPAPALDP